MLLSSICGASLGDAIGSAFADITSSALSTTIRLWNRVEDQLSAVTDTSQMVRNSNYGFFGSPVQSSNEPEVVYESWQHT